MSKRTREELERLAHRISLGPDARDLEDAVDALLDAALDVDALAREVAAREQAERDRDEWREPWRITAANGQPIEDGLYLAPALVLARLRDLTEAEKVLRELSEWRIPPQPARAYFAGRPAGDTAE
jgi:hypothetical protein